MQLGINTDFDREFDTIEEIEESLWQIAKAGFTHMHWCYEWDGDYIYAVCQNDVVIVDISGETMRQAAKITMEDPDASVTELYVSGDVLNLVVQRWETVAWWWLVSIYWNMMTRLLVSCMHPVSSTRSYPNG